MTKEVEQNTDKRVEQGIGCLQAPPALPRQAIFEAYFSPSTKRGKPAEILLSQNERQKLQRTVQILASNNLQRFIEQGKVTFGAIKPNTKESNLGVETDEQGARNILEIIEASSLDLMFTVSVPLTGEDLDEFYSDIKPRLKAIQKNGLTEWDGFVNFMQSGPVTYFLLCDQEGDAVEKWRKLMGPTNPEEAPPGTIRGDYALITRQNLVHGASRGPEDDPTRNVRKEATWLLKKLESFLEQNKEDYFPSGELLYQFGVLDRQDRLILITLLKSKRAGDDVFLTAYNIIYENEAGEITSKKLARKSIVTMSGALEVIAKGRFKRLKLLNRYGVSTPEFYGIAGADIYEQYIEGERPVEEAFKLLKSSETPEETRLHLLNQLVRMAAVFDKCGFIPTGEFYKSCIFDGKNIYYVDTGFELGDPRPDAPNKISKKHLLERLRRVGLEHVGSELYRQAYKRAKIN